MSEPGESRRGQVIEVNPVGHPEGSVEVEWSDGTRSVLEPKRPPVVVDSWLKSLRKTGKCGDPLCACRDIDLNDNNEESPA